MFNPSISARVHVSQGYVSICCGDSRVVCNATEQEAVSLILALNPHAVINVFRPDGDETTATQYVDGQAVSFVQIPF